MSSTLLAEIKGIFNFLSRPLWFIQSVSSVRRSQKRFWNVHFSLYFLRLALLTILTLLRNLKEWMAVNGDGVWSIKSYFLQLCTVFNESSQSSLLYNTMKMAHECENLWWNIKSPTSSLQIFSSFSLLYIFYFFSPSANFSFICCHSFSCACIKTPKTVEVNIKIYILLHSSRLFFSLLHSRES